MRDSSKFASFGFILLLLLSFSSFGQAYDKEKEAKAIEGQLMSPCCWGGTVAEHNSQAAIDIKRGIRTMLSEGKSRDQILAYYEKEFGERILSAPKKTGFNLVAWILPFVIFFFGSLLVLFYLKRIRPGQVKASEQVAMAESGTKEETPEDDKYRKEIDRELYGS